MTISIKSPTSTTGSIQKNGSDVLTIDSSDNVTVVNNLSVSGTVSSTGAITFDGGTISGDVNFDSGTLYVDATNNRVGVGTTTPSQKLHVVGGQSYVTGSAGSGAYSRWYNNAQTTNDLQIGQGWSSGSDNVGFVLNNANADLLFGTNGSERMRINSSGQVGIGTTNIPTTSALIVKSNWGSATMRVYNTSGSNVYLMSFHNSTAEVGSISTGASSTSYNTSSDYRLKNNVAPMSGSIDRIKQLKPSTWSWVQDGSHGEGFLAHEAQAVVPEAVTGTKDAVDDEGNPVYQGIDQSKLVPLLTSALQEAITKIEDLETRIQALENPS